MRRVLFFHATWCRPCIFYEKQFIRPLEARAGPEYITRVDVQNDPFTADKYLVDKLPAVVLLDGEKVVMERTGAIDIVMITGWLEGGEVGFD